MLAGAIAGRKISVEVSDNENAIGFSDGKTLFLPASHAIDDLLQWPLVVSQACMIAAGSLDASVLRYLVGRQRAVQRYVYLEVLRATRFCNDRLPLRFTDLVELRNAQALSDSAAKSLTIALSAVPLPPTPGYFGTIKPLATLRRAIGDERFATWRNRALASSPGQNAVPELADDMDTESSKILKLFQNPLARGNRLSNWLNALFGSGHSKNKPESNSPENAGAELPINHVERAIRRTANMHVSTSVHLPDIAIPGTRQALRYPEWDAHRQSYRQNWVSVEEAEAWRPDGPQEIAAAIYAPITEWKRQLASLGLDHELHRRQPDGADLDVGALLDCAIDLQTNQSPSTLNVYRASRRTRRDLAVVILLDVSGSTGEKDLSETSVFMKQLRLTYQLGLTLDALGDSVAILGFHSWGRHLVRVVRIKGYEEHWNAKVAERLALLEPIGYTRIGTAIRHGDHLLRSGMRLPNRLLVLITDGIAYDQEYEDRYAEADTRKALEEAKAGGTACVCLSVGSSTEIEKLSSVFGATNFLAVDEVEQITAKIRELCRRALATVSRRQLGRI
jgi:Mg-chelatase subunit ChlD